MKQQMKTTCRVSLIASVAGKKSQNNVPEHMIVSSTLTDLILRRIAEEEQPSLNKQICQIEATHFKIQN